MLDRFRSVVLTALLGSIIVLGLGTGCRTARGLLYRPPSVGSFDVEVTSATGNRTVEVHIFGINGTDHVKWSTYSMTKYWGRGQMDPVRGDAEGVAVKVKFGQGQETSLSLGKDAPVWESWQKPRYLVVLADLPGFFKDDDKDGDADPRRLIVPLEKRRWGRGQQIGIKISAGGIGYSTPPIPLI